MPDSTPGTQAATPDQNRRSAEISALPRPATPDAGDRYELHDLIAKGGMGAVYRAWDAALKRDVAVKVLLDHAQDFAPARRRFEYEATVTAQLQHPSVPPVYDLGTLVNGSPFLAMKLIKGQTLDARLRARPDAGHDRGHLVGVFEAICQAVGYAHSRGVLHRDLKPANVMVGPFGEVQVMDWGLAKFRGDATAAAGAAGGSDASTFVDPRAADDSRTGDGAVLGTPAYMPPEQAVGAVDRVTERSDVFGLGAILCRILTDRPPFVGGDAASAHRLAAAGEVADAFARLDACGAEPELVALCKRCLAPDPADRPANGAAVAAEVSALRADAERRARQAETDRAKAEVRAAEQRQRQRLWAWSATAVVAVLAAGTAVSVWQMLRAQTAEGKIGQELLNTKAAKDEADENARKEKKAKDLAEKNEQEAKSQELSARKQTRHALDINNDMVFAVQSKLETQPGTQRLRKELLEKARDGLAKIMDEARKQGSPDSTLVWSHFRMGDVERTLGNTAAAEKEYRAGHALAVRLAAADPADPVAQRNVCVSLQRLGEAAEQLGRLDDALGHFTEMNALARRLAAADPTNAEAQRDLSWSLNGLGDVAIRRGKTKDALDHYQGALAIAERLAAADPTNAQAQRDLHISYTRVGDVTLELREMKAARDVYRKAKDIAGRLAAADPDNAQARRDLTVGLHKLGYLNRVLGDREAALAVYGEMNAIQKRLAAADPNNFQAQRDLAISHDNLGDVTLDLDRPTDAVGHYEASLAVRRRLADADPNNAQARRDLGRSFSNLGDVAEKLRRWPDAEGHYREWSRIVERLAAADPNDARSHRDLGMSYSKIGGTLEQRGQFLEAAEMHRKALAVHRRRAEADTKGAEAQRDLLVAFFALGYVAQRTEDYAAAVGWYEQAIDVATRFEKPALFANEVGVVKGRLGDCKANLPAKRRETAPPPRASSRD
jgi:tetratricopeptide (TPR) repeat protein